MSTIISKKPITASKEMMQNGFVAYPFPANLANAMKSHIVTFIGAPASSESITKALTEKSLSYSDDEFTTKFAKPFRMFPDAVAHLAVDWVSSLRADLGGKKTGVNYVSEEERQKNSQLRLDSYDVFWRCVRPGKPDVGAAHCDYQFWEIAKGTPAEVNGSFAYDERWKIWVPLMGCDPTNSLQVVPGSHLEDVPTDKVATKKGVKPIIKPHWLEKHEKSFICPLTSFGTHCVLFHDKLVHRGPLNNTKNLRLSGELTILLKL